MINSDLNLMTNSDLNLMSKLSEHCLIDNLRILRDYLIIK
jgi:hypothetical protein